MRVDLFNLSCLPFQMKLKISFSRLSLYILFMTVILAKYVNCGMISDLIIRILPMIVRCLFSQDFMSFFAFSNLFSQFSFAHSALFVPKYNPNTLTGLSVNFILSTLSLQFFSFPIQIPSVLFLFNLRPENVPNISITFNAAIISFFDLRKRVVSSANWEIFKLCFEWSSLISKPLMVNHSLIYMP